jgi:hypothetical protein
MHGSMMQAVSARFAFKFERVFSDRSHGARRPEVPSGRKLGREAEGTEMRGLLLGFRMLRLLRHRATSVFSCELLIGK